MQLLFNNLSLDKTGYRLLKPTIWRKILYTFVSTVDSKYNIEIQFKYTQSADMTFLIKFLDAHSGTRHTTQGNKTVPYQLIRLNLLLNNHFDTASMRFACTKQKVSILLQRTAKKTH